MYLWEGTDNKKYIGITTMNTCFIVMLERFYQAQDDAEKSKIYDEMEEYAYLCKIQNIFTPEGVYNTLKNKATVIRIITAQTKITIFFINSPFITLLYS